MGNRPVKKFCYIRDNTDIRMVIKLRLKEFNVAQLCRELDIDRMNFQHYLDGSNSRAISQYDLWRVCGKVGIKIKISVEFI